MGLKRAGEFLSKLVDRPFRLSAKERETLLAIGLAACPAEGGLPAFDADAAERLERFLATGSPPEIRILCRSMIHLVNREAVLRHFKPLTKLDADKAAAYLDRHWVHGLIFNRLAFRLFAVMLKGSYFDDARLYAALGLVYDRPPVVEERPRWMGQVTRGAEVTEDAAFDADAVVVGTGAGGAAAALEIAKAGHAVVLLEAGEYFTRRHFTGRGFEMQRTLYRQHGLTATVGNVTIPLPLGQTVGGSTTINSGTCFRTPERTLARWRSDLGLSAFTPASMEPYFARVEALLRVAPADMKHVGMNGEIIARGAIKLGWSHGPLVRNAPDCDGQALCAFGCPAGAKRSADVSLVPAALEKGAQLYCRVRAGRVLLDGNRAAGVEARSIDTGRRITIKARVVVLASGAIGTPQLLMRQRIGNSSGQVGKNLSIHPATAIYAIMDELVEPQKAIPQGYMVDEFHDDGILLEGGTLPLEMFSMMVPEVGREGQRIMAAYRHISMFGVMVCDRSRGRVLPGGAGSPVAYYWLNREDFATMRRGVELLTRVYLAAGAREVHPMIYGWKTIRTEDDLASNMAKKIRPIDVDISAYHPLGTCHMGGNKRKAVCTPDGELWDVKNLFIADGSLIPPGLGVNPQITIAAVATRVGEYIGRKLA